MSILRLFTLGAIGYMIAQLLRAFTGAAPRPEAVPPQSRRRAMVRCESCGVYVLEERALASASGSYCSPACRP